MRRGLCQSYILSVLSLSFVLYVAKVVLRVVSAVALYSHRVIAEILPWTYQSAIPLKKLFLTGQKDLSY